MPSNHIPRPRVACEISAERVVAGRAGEGAQTLDAASARVIPDGALVPGLQQANVTAREVLVAALRDALSAVAGRSRDVCLVIPDATTRIMLLDFDTLPAKPEEADARPPAGRCSPRQPRGASLGRAACGGPRSGTATA